MKITVKDIPNALTTMRMALSIPIFILLILENYSPVLWIVFVAGITDALDGFLARKLNAVSRYGSIADPLSDKLMMTLSYLAFAIVDLIPWWVTAIVIGRDIIIVSGALAYHHVIGRYDMAPSIPGKVSTFVQITFALTLIVQQVWPVVPAVALSVLYWGLIVMAFVSGGDYVLVWGVKAVRESKEAE